MDLIKKLINDQKRVEEYFQEIDLTLIPEELLPNIDILLHKEIDHFSSPKLRIYPVYKLSLPVKKMISLFNKGKLNNDQLAFLCSQNSLEELNKEIINTISIPRIPVPEKSNINTFKNSMGKFLKDIPHELLPRLFAAGEKEDTLPGAKPLRLALRKLFRKEITLDQLENLIKSYE